MLTPNDVGRKHRGRFKRLNEVSEMLKLQGLDLKVKDVTPNTWLYIKHGFNPADMIPES